MIQIATFLGTALGRYLIGGGLILIGWIGFAKHYENKGASRVVAKIEQRNSANANKAERARRSVDSLSDDRLRDPYFRD